ncbi:uncharacterized protein LOC126457583 isoform X2 [Schistocerca serialis cubense]|nr:uncharacterized protein LOC126457583 isoform X2 [Schistocerca serialis cubense]XP_049949967.1 uncharacterized protein LOC126457583 isoform X2 [Schistocerca serialis cubense]
MGVDFLVSPRCYQLYAAALKSSQSSVPEDWKEQLARAVEDLPEDATVHELIKTVAALSPDRARTLIQVLEEEVSVMEDVVDHEALERIKRIRREQQTEMKALAATAKQTRVAALEAYRQLMTHYPTFQWDPYYSDPNYLQNLVYERDAEERRAEQEKVEDTIEQNLAEKKFLMAEIQELREQRAVLQSRMDDGCELDLEEELRKARRENQLLRDHYTHLCSLVEQQEPRSPCSPSSDY